MWINQGVLTHLQGFVSKNRHRIFHRCLIAIRNIYSLHHHRLLAAVAEGEYKSSVVANGYAHFGVYCINEWVLTQEKSHSRKRMAFFSEINPLRDLWNALRAWNTLRVWNALRRVRGFISFHIATKEQYFTISEGNYFTFGISRIFHFLLPSYLLFAVFMV